MPTASYIVLEIVCPTLGTIMANLMFSAPYRDVKKAVAQGHLGDLNPTPWAFMLGNCCGWVTYSILIQNLWVFFSNAPGFVLSVWLNMGAAKLQYQAHHAKEMRKSFANYLTKSQRELQMGSSRLIRDDGEHEPQSTNQDDENDGPIRKMFDFGKVVYEVTSQISPAPARHETVTMVLVLIWVAAIALVSFSADSFSFWTRQLIIGVLVNLNLVFFYGAPLSTIITVLKTHNTASIHIWTMITNTANGTFWTAYGFAVQDQFIWVPNGLGALLGVIQMFLCMAFPRNPSSPVTDAKSDIIVTKDSKQVDQTVKTFDEEAAGK